MCAYGFFTRLTWIWDSLLLFCCFFLAITTRVLHGNYVGGGEGIVYLCDQLQQLPKPVLQLGTKYQIPNEFPIIKNVRPLVNKMDELGVWTKLQQEY